MKKFFKNLIIFLFIIFILGAIGFSIYLYSPEVKPGEVGLLYKTAGNGKGFTGKILTPGKYYCFITPYNPFINKIYKFKIKAKEINDSKVFYPGIRLDYSAIYIIDKNRINDFFERVDIEKANNIVKLYLSSAFKMFFLKSKVEDLFSKTFQVKIADSILSKVNNDLKFFGLKITKLNIDKLLPTKALKDIYDKIQCQEKELANLQIEMEKKLKEKSFENKLKEQQLQYMLRKAETEKEITRLKTESMKLLREEAKERMLQEVEIFSKKGGDLAAKLEAIRILSKSVKNPEQVLDKVNNVFRK